MVQEPQPPSADSYFAGRFSVWLILVLVGIMWALNWVSAIGVQPPIKPVEQKAVE